MAVERRASPRQSSHPEVALDLPIPFGWFAVGYGSDLAPGAVQPLYVFDQHAVMFRTRDGRAHVTDAFCPHLGAHLGHGGAVEGDVLVCPFHGWRFSGDGVCAAIPYATTLPRRATGGPCLYSYPVQERNGLIWAWHHPRRLPPTFDLDEVAELADSTWTEPDRYDWEVETPIQEAGENAVDIAHFVAVHGLAELPEARITLNGHRRTTHLTCKAPAIDRQGNVDLTRSAQIELVTKNCGPGMSTQAFRLGAEAVMLAAVTPLDAKRMRLRAAFTRRKGIGAKFETLIDALIGEVVRQVEQDIPIWEHKICRSSPILCDGDGPIAQYRRWFSQFYDSCPA